MDNNLTGGTAADMIPVKTPWVAPAVVETDIEAITMSGGSTSSTELNTSAS